jgi:hypothetical protein
MKSPDVAGNESARIAALRALDILDTEPEARFDRLTRLSQRMFAVPIALVSLVDEIANGSNPARAWALTKPRGTFPSAATPSSVTTYSWCPMPWPTRDSPITRW